MGVNEQPQDPMARWYFMQEVSDRIVGFPRRSKLQRAIMYCMVAFASLHSPEIEKLRHIFDSADFRRAFDILDVDKTGYIEASDLSRLLPHVFNTAELEHEIR